MLITCPECAATMSDKAAFCPHCGYAPITQKKPIKAPLRSQRKHPRLPNGFGSIKKLSGRRTNPYAVHPTASEVDDKGYPITPKAIAYAKDWYTAFGILSAYNAGTYKPGQEIVFDDTQITDNFVNDIISAYNYGISNRKSELDMSFAEVYDQYIRWDFGEMDSCTDPAKLRRLKTRKRSMTAAYRNCETLHNRIFRSLKYADLQAVIDECPLKHASKELIIVLFHKMYKYADISDIQKEDRSRHVTIKTDDDDTAGIPFTDTELRRIWENRDDPVLEMVFIMCLSGFRIQAYTNISVNLQDGYFQGGLKTKSGTGRIVPIHSAIYDLVKRRMQRENGMMEISTQHFRKLMYASLERIGVEKHTPHDCRDTFATLCDRAKVDKTYLKRLMGHSLSSDITEEKYIHPSLKSLREEIEKIDMSLIVSNDRIL